MRLAVSKTASGRSSASSHSTVSSTQSAASAGEFGLALAEHAPIIAKSSATSAFIQGSPGIKHS